MIASVRLLSVPMLALWLGTSVTAFAQDFCQASDTNQLLGNKDFARAITSYFGDRKTYLFWKNATIAHQVLAGLGGPPDPLQRVDASTVLVSACRHQSCIEKAAVVIACPATIKAVGVIHYACEHGAPGCAEKPILTIYGNGEDGKRASEQSRRALMNWTRTVLGEKAEAMESSMEAATVYAPEIVKPQ